MPGFARLIGKSSAEHWYLTQVSWLSVIPHFLLPAYTDSGTHAFSCGLTCYSHVNPSLSLVSGPLLLLLGQQANVSPMTHKTFTRLNQEP